MGSLAGSSCAVALVLAFFLVFLQIPGNIEGNQNNAGACDDADSILVKNSVQKISNPQHNQ